MIYLLDTNMVSYIVKGRSLAASKRLVALPRDEVAALSAITVAEIRYGLAKKPKATALKSLMDSFLNSIQVLPWRTDEAEAYGIVRAKLENKRPHAWKHGPDDCRPGHRCKSYTHYER